MTYEKEFMYLNENGEEQYFTIEFEAYPRVENDGIGWYEYWGSHEFDKGHDYVSLEYNGDPVWDKSRYPDWQNKIVESMTRKEWEDLCDRICEEWIENKNDC